MLESAIICVDDEVTILESLKEQLKRTFGDRYIYEVAESADEAWEIIEELKADNINIILIVSDWLMPKTKGDEFLIEVCCGSFGVAPRRSSQVCVLFYWG